MYVEHGKIILDWKVEMHANLIFLNKQIYNTYFFHLKIQNVYRYFKTSFIIIRISRILLYKIF